MSSPIVRSEADLIVLLSRVSLFNHSVIANLILNSIGCEGGDAYGRTVFRLSVPLFA
jgi:hypothetical protein